MKSLREAIISTLEEDEHCLSCLHDGHLNLTSYAKARSEHLRAATGKELSVNTIVVALARYRDELLASPRVAPVELSGSDIAVRSNLAEVVFEKDSATKDFLSGLLEKSKSSGNEFFNLTLGQGEISVITNERTLTQALAETPEMKPKLVTQDIAAITVNFSPECLAVPGVIDHLVHALAKRSVNLVEIVSTFTELSVVVRTEDLETAFLAWNQIINRKRNV